MKLRVVAKSLAICLVGVSVANVSASTTGSASVSSSPSSPSPSPVAIAPPPALSDGSGMGNADGGGNSNPVAQLAGYVKDSFVRMKDGSAQLYTNHKRCNEIRAKQKTHLATLAATFPENSPEQKAAKRYKINAGGITYEEFDFLQKGKDDRGKLSNIVFMMFFAPNFVPYAFMFFPEMLPSPFAMPANKMGMPFISKWDNISRERSHAVIQTMLDFEKNARVAPMMSNLNPFGKGRTRRMMERMDQMGRQAGGLLMSSDASGSRGAELILKVLKNDIYTEEKPRKDSANLISLPKPLIKGLGRALEAPTFNSLLPVFFVRGKVLNSLKQIEISDDFLVQQNVDLKSLSMDLLQEACSARLIGGPGRSKDEMAERLESWLDLSVKQPEKVAVESGMHVNSNLIRAALLSYNALDGARDNRSSSYLPRLMYQGQLYSRMRDEQQQAVEEEASTTKTSRQWKKKFIK